MTTIGPPSAQDDDYRVRMRDQQHAGTNDGLPVDADGNKYLPAGDMGAANWALSRLAGLQEKVDRVEALYADQLERLDGWKAGELAVIEGSAGWFRTALTDWHRRQLAEDKRATSVKLPAGTLSSRKSGATVKVTDPAALAEWMAGRFDADDLADLLNAPAAAKPSITGIKARLGDVFRPGPVAPEGVARLLDADGEIVPGAEFVPESRTFTVKL